MHSLFFSVVLTLLFLLHRLSEQRDGRSGPAALPHPAAHFNSAEGQTGRLQTDRQAAAAATVLHHRSPPLHRLLTAQERGRWQQQGGLVCLTYSWVVDSVKNVISAEAVFH